MFLKSLTLKGFKSFADPVSLHLEPGVTVVVGPNGSGKSNVVDAIAWVLGAQGARALRGSKMEDVIFAGSANRPALGRAEVALTIDNRAGHLPGGLAEITITRTLFRNGDSEYAMNGQPCRLLDIQELLSDSGVGRTQHVIVGQGQLDHILNARPEERRAVIEEASGVLKHRRRRERAERRLSAAEENLERLADLLRELRRQIRPLERQATAARSYGRLSEELRTLRMYLAGRELSGLADRLRDGRATRDGLQAQSVEVKDQLRLIDEEVERATAELSSRDDEDLVLGIARAQGLLERSFGLTNVLGERRRSLDRALEAAADVDVVSSLEAETARITEQLSEADAEVSAQQPDFVSLEMRDAELVEESLELRLLDDESALRSARQAVDMAKAHLDAAVKSSQSDGERLERLRQHRATMDGRLADLESERTTLVSQLETIVSDVSALEAIRSEADAARAVAQRNVDDGEKTVKSANRDHDRAESRAQSLAGALKALQGADGREALDGATGVLGAFQDLVEVDSGYEGAFEAALSALIGSVVVENPHAAGAVELLRERQVSGVVLPAGSEQRESTSGVLPTRNTTWPTESTTWPTESTTRPTESTTRHRTSDSHWRRVGWREAVGLELTEESPSSGVAELPPPGVEPLALHVRCNSSALRTLLEELLANAMVVEGDWRDAAELSRSRPDLSFLTRDGDRFSSSGWSIGKAALGLTPAVVNEAHATAAEAGRVAEAAAVALRSSQESLATAKSALAKAERELADAVARRVSVERSIEQKGAVARALEDEAAVGRRELESLSARIELAEETIGGLRSEVTSLEQKAVAVGAGFEQAESRRKDHARRKTELDEFRRQVQIRSAALDERRQVLAARLEDLERRLSGHAQERREAQERRRRIVSDGHAVVRLLRVVELHQSRVESFAGHLNELRERQVEMLRAGGARLEDLRRRRIATDEQLAAIRDRHQKLDVELAEVGARHQAANEALSRELDCSPQDALATECPELPDGATPKKRAAELQNELQKMGPINPLAAEELSELEQRNEFLEREVDDVRRARRELQQMIRTVDEEITRLFAEAFEDVDRHFQVLVGAMFPGGAGRLSLTEPTDILATGVELEARPAGKQVRKLSLLSGGERSLVALAFLFAVFRSRPSPFYVMDEVEAALDDVNLHRFLGLLHEFRGEAQLIVVSHQKRTMESADALYGVTMTPGGSSKVVSQKVKAKGSLGFERSGHQVAEPV